MEGIREVSAGEAVEVLTAITAALPHRISGTRVQRVEVLAALEALARSVHGVSLQVLADMEIEPDDSLGNRPVADVVADQLRLTPVDARSRIRLAERLTERTSLQGQPLPPMWAELGKLVQAGEIGADHLAVAREFFKRLPARVDGVTRDFCESRLAEWARAFRPDEMRKLAIELDKRVRPDGDEPDAAERARKRHVTMNRQGADKMTTGRFCLDPATAAGLEAWLARFARRGVCNPDSSGDPILDGTPSPEAVSGDTRTYGQRCHDALAVMIRNALADENLGRHRGLPVTIVLTADINDLTTSPTSPAGAARRPTPCVTGNDGTDSTSRPTSDSGTDRTPRPTDDGTDPAPGPTGGTRSGRAPHRAGGAGSARTSGGTLVPIRDLRRMGQHAAYYLALFDGATPLALYHGRDCRLATPAQRLMLLAAERGCSYPGCARGGVDCQVHHANGDWQHGGNTDITDLTLVCDRHHPLAGDGPRQWRTRKRDGVTDWIPPKTVDPQQKPRRNHFHHPEHRIQRPEPDDPG